MTLVCPSCDRILEFSGERPSFCAYCGRRLEDPRLLQTVTHAPGRRRISTPDELTTAYPPRGEPAPAPERIAGYRLLRALGSGGMGTVYEAEDEAVGRRVALKLIAPEFVASRDAVERFRQEGRLASALEHPRCVFVFGADEHEGRPYIVMELMPGATLQALVEENGPLGVEEAIARVLDIIEGLDEAHHLGIIHRDIKPSNCFLGADGRAKIGDFGLSKSLTSDSSLTRTGSFVGTPLYASPEQIKSDPLDERSDQYSLAATLYYLLAGRPPYRESDAAATLARIVSEPPAPLRKWRPDVPPALEAVILRAMDRDRDRRFRALAEFRDALLPFGPRPFAPGRPGLRSGAFLFDAPVVLVPERLIDWYLAPAWAAPPCHAALWVAYFAATEGLWGAGLGKRLAGLRVSDRRVAAPPGLARGAVRALSFYLLVLVWFDVGELLYGWSLRRHGLFVSGAALLGTIGMIGLALLLLFTTMRPANGFRGPHELISGTRVVQVFRRSRRRVPRTRRPIRRMPSAAARPAGVVEAIGPFAVHGAVRWEPDRRVLQGEDSGLGRRVWIELRPSRGEPLSPARRELNRPTRPRWLTGGERSEGRWDAYVAPSGCSLADLAGPRGLPWGELRPILEDLAAELAFAVEDGTLPARLSPEQVWVQPDGGALLVDSLAPAGPDPGPDDEPTRRALELLARAAALGLEGGRHRHDGPLKPIHAPVPRHIAEMLHRLVGRARAYASVGEFLDDLRSGHDRPTEVGTGRRLAHLGIQSALHAPGLLMMFASSYFAVATEAGTGWIATLPVAVLAWPAVWILWSAATRGGLSLRLMDLTLSRADGRPAGRLRCLWRSLLIWAAPTGLLLLAVTRPPEAARDAWICWGAALALMPLSVVVALFFPDRGPHDRLAGTYVVPL